MKSISTFTHGLLAIALLTSFQSFSEVTSRPVEKKSLRLSVLSKTAIGVTAAGLIGVGVAHLWMEKGNANDSFSMTLALGAGYGVSVTGLILGTVASFNGLTEEEKVALSKDYQGLLRTARAHNRSGISPMTDAYEVMMTSIDCQACRDDADKAKLVTKLLIEVENLSFAQAREKSEWSEENAKAVSQLVSERFAQVMEEEASTKNLEVFQRAVALRLALLSAST